MAGLGAAQSRAGFGFVVGVAVSGPVLSADRSPDATSQRARPNARDLESATITSFLRLGHDRARWQLDRPTGPATLRLSDSVAWCLDFGLVVSDKPRSSPVQAATTHPHITTNHDTSTPPHPRPQLLETTYLNQRLSLTLFCSGLFEECYPAESQLCQLNLKSVR